MRVRARGASRGTATSAASTLAFVPAPGRLHITRSFIAPLALSAQGAPLAAAPPAEPLASAPAGLVSSAIARRGASGAGFGATCFFPCSLESERNIAISASKASISSAVASRRVVAIPKDSSSFASSPFTASSSSSSSTPSCASCSSSAFNSASMAACSSSANSSSTPPSSPSSSSPSSPESDVSPSSSASSSSLIASPSTGGGASVACSSSWAIASPWIGSDAIEASRRSTAAHAASYVAGSLRPGRSSSRVSESWKRTSKAIVLQNRYRER
mmetsp:Transcript_10281/g.31528  ORF Transcript_10281/g.31528 Transcript_10281/m.31528 type:complete len:273 (-) Transcript_10281:524-1342(-)